MKTSVSLARTAAIVMPVSLLQLKFSSIPAFHMSSFTPGWNMCQVAVLVNNAGLALGKSPAQDNDVADISVMLDTNCKAVAVLTKAVSKGMIARNMVPSNSPHLEASLPKSRCFASLARTQGLLPMACSCQ